MTVIKRVKVDNEQLDELLHLGDMAKMGFASDTDAVRFAIREGIDKLRHAVVMRRNLGTEKDAALIEEAVPAEA